MLVLWSNSQFINLGCFSLACTFQPQWDSIRNEMCGRGKKEATPIHCFHYLGFIKSHCGIEMVIIPESGFKSSDVLSALLFCNTNEFSLCNEKKLETPTPHFS